MLTCIPSARDACEHEEDEWHGVAPVLSAATIHGDRPGRPCSQWYHTIAQDAQKVAPKDKVKVHERNYASIGVEVLHCCIRDET
jgi:hypothetical protein